MNRELLEKPFSPDEIKQRQGNFGKTLDYIEAHAIIQRLNDAFNAEWSFRILAHKVFRQEDEVLVLGELTAGDIVKTQFGSSKITRAKETGEIISLSDDLKSAATDALKKSATLLGIGLHLYNGAGAKFPDQNGATRGRCDMDFEPVEGTTNVYKPKFSPKREEGTAPHHNNNGNGAMRRQLSIKQFNYIKSLGKERFGYSLEDLTQKSVEIFGVQMDGLTTADASNFIRLLESGEIRSASM